MGCAERFFRTIERREADRPACWLGLPDARASPGLGLGYVRKRFEDISDAAGLPIMLQNHSGAGGMLNAAQGAGLCEDRVFGAVSPYMKRISL
ncbi:MAG: hypothetical protein LBJ10_05620 [Clostridiales bacterium]|jgi:hypothetical protein|nr:hypothetical protein [Clostridiales bacterium]